MKKFEVLKKELLMGSEVSKEYEERKVGFAVARSLIRARLEAKMTQEEVANKMKTSQSQVARIESGHHIPSFSSVKKYAVAVNRAINVEVNP